MWNRQREAEAAREALALSGEDNRPPNRNPPQIDEIESGAVPAEKAAIETIHAAE
jgi:hypothetical protein